MHHVVALFDHQAFVIGRIAAHHHLEVRGLLAAATVGHRAQRIGQHACRIDLRLGQVCTPGQQHRVAGGHRAEGGVERGARGRMDELVGVEEPDQLRVEDGHHLAIDVRDFLRLVVAEDRIVEHDQRQAFALQRREDLARAVGRAVVDDDHQVHQRDVVAHEGFDDVGLVLDHRDRKRIHVGGGLVCRLLRGARALRRRRTVRRCPGRRSPRASCGRWCVRAASSRSCAASRA